MGIQTKEVRLIGKLLAWLGCLIFLGSPGAPSKSYLKAGEIKILQPFTKCLKSEKNQPISLTQRARVLMLAFYGWRVIGIIEGVGTTGYAIGDGHTPGTRTACGVRARFGIVAVDPRTIRLKSHLFIPGYGFGCALDTGGRIKGKRVDLCFNSPEGAIKHGVKRKDVYILERAF